MVLDSIIYAGQLRGNPNARVANSLKLPVDVTAKSGQDTVTFANAAAKAVTSFTYQGVVYPLVNCTHRTDTEIKSQIYAILSAFEIQPILNVTYVGTTLTIRHVGGGALSSVMIDGTARATTRVSNLAIHGDYVANVVGTVSTVVVDGVSEAITGSPFAYTGNSTTDSATAATLKAAIEGALTTLTFTATTTVAVDDVKGKFKVTIKGLSGKTVSIGGQSAVETNFKDVFVA